MGGTAGVIFSPLVTPINAYKKLEKGESVGNVLKGAAMDPVNAATEPVKAIGRAFKKKEYPVDAPQRETTDESVSEAQSRLDQTRAENAAARERNASRSRQENLAAGARASRRRSGNLTSPLGQIDELAGAISKTLLGT